MAETPTDEVGGFVLQCRIVGLLAHEPDEGCEPVFVVEASNGDLIEDEPVATLVSPSRTTIELLADYELHILANGFVDKEREPNVVAAFGEVRGVHPSENATPGYLSVNLVDERHSQGLFVHELNIPQHFADRMKGSLRRGGRLAAVLVPKGETP